MYEWDFVAISEIWADFNLSRCCQRSTSPGFIVTEASGHWDRKRKSREELKYSRKRWQSPWISSRYAKWGDINHWPLPVEADLFFSVLRPRNKCGFFLFPFPVKVKLSIYKKPSTQNVLPTLGVYLCTVPPGRTGKEHQPATDWGVNQDCALNTPWTQRGS